MPELPEITALASFLADHARGQQIVATSVLALNVMTTYDPPPTALNGRIVTGAGRHGKFLDIVTAPGPESSDTDGDLPDDRPSSSAPGGGDALHLILHLARAGWLRWADSLAKTPPKMGGPTALRVRLASGAGFDVTEAGTRKSLTAAVVREPLEVPGIARLGPDALSLDRAALAERLAGKSGRIKTVMTDQTVIAGIGNAYSDEILHTARLSPYATAGALSSDELDRLAVAMESVLRDAVQRSVGQQAARLKGEKRTGLRVHARAGLPCPVCGDVIGEVSFADRSFQYCPTCQTGGRRLADRRRSRLLK